MLVDYYIWSTLLFSFICSRNNLKAENNLCIWKRFQKPHLDYEEYRLKTVVLEYLRSTAIHHYTSRTILNAKYIPQNYLNFLIILFVAMVSKLDQSVGAVIDALANKGILNNTILLFLSDNGGPTVGLHATTASNYPLRGVSTKCWHKLYFTNFTLHFSEQQKNSPWEGGIRSSGVIWSPLLENLGTVWKQQLYIGDLLPTLASAANIQLDTQQMNLDGLNLWSALKYGYDAVEREIVHNIDDIFDYVSYGKGKWKFINGTTDDGEYDGWLSVRHNDSNAEMDPRAANYEELIMNTTVWQHLSEINAKTALPGVVNITKLRQDAAISCMLANATQGVACEPLLGPCLFDIAVDPCEQNNLYEAMSDGKVVQELLKRIAHFRETAHVPNNKPLDAKCDPRLYDGEWTWWEDVQDGVDDDHNGDDGDSATNIRLSGLLLTLSFGTVFVINLLKYSCRL